MLTTYITVAAVAYLLGSIPFGYILVKLFLKQDIRQTGSGNIGATNVARSGKKGLAIATLLLDAGKGAAAVYVAGFAARRFLHPEDSLIHPDQLALPVLGALCAIVGHVFPIWLRFRGGKGVATAVGAFIALSPFAVGICLGVFAVVFAITRYVSAASIIATTVFPFLADGRVGANYEDAGPYFILTRICLIACALLIILKHHANIRRLLNGTEPKFGVKKPVIPPDPIQVEKNA